MLIFDAHLDLAMNALEWNRDLTRPIDEIRQRENGMTDKPDRGRGTVCLSEMRRGGIGLCVATQIARIQHNAYSPVFGWRSQEQAWAQTQGQLAWYRAMEEAGQMYARTTHRCYICNRKLTVADSLATGIGPDCAGNRKRKELDPQETRQADGDVTQAD